MLAAIGVTEVIIVVVVLVVLFRRKAASRPRPCHWPIG